MQGSLCCRVGLGDMTSRSDSSRNTLGPSLTLELDYLLADFNESDRDEEIRQVLLLLLLFIQPTTTITKAELDLGEATVFKCTKTIPF